MHNPPSSEEGLPRTISGAEALVRVLEASGVRTVFGLCGHTNIAVLDALSRSPIDFVVTRHEQVAAHAADGYARMTGRTGVVLLHVGPGMMNAVTGIATAALDSYPVVAIAGDVPSYYKGRHPHQEINLHSEASQADIYRSFTKQVWSVTRPEDIARSLERALWTASGGRPGAVLVNIPMDFFSRFVTDPNTHAVEDHGAGEYDLSPSLSVDKVRAIATNLVAAQDPVLYVGGGLRRPGGRRALSRLAEILDAPILHSLMGKGTVSDEHPLLVGMTGFWGTELANEYAVGRTSSWPSAHGSPRPTQARGMSATPGGFRPAS